MNFFSECDCTCSWKRSYTINTLEHKLHRYFVCETSVQMRPFSLSRYEEFQAASENTVKPRKFELRFFETLANLKIYICETLNSQWFQHRVHTESEASICGRSLFWYLSLFIMCKAWWHQYNERPLEEHSHH